ncbi:MAG: pyridoxal phosphate-dependent aminotransferase [Candidatus Doudnabacteria bacterium]|nr:pyridoxal phosphate-dependent aminotransferase [Candidatus Doudnabacteria bacterium]
MQKLQVSKRGQDVIASPIRKFLPLMQATEKKGIKVLKINVGDPDLQPPAEFFKVVRSYAGKSLPYTPSPGIPAHTAAWQTYFRQFGVELPMSGIIPTVGCAEAILLAMQAVCDPGDELMVFEPLYSSYKSFAVMTGIKLVPVLLPFEKNFALPPAAEIEKKISAKTKAIVVINPDNPTGKLWTDQELKTVVAIAKKHNLFIISDETYREIRFDGKKPASLLADKSAREHVIVCDSASKRFTMPGARTGVVVSFNEQVMRTLLKFAQARLSTPTLEQLGLVPVLNNSKPYVNKIVKEYKKRRDVIAEGLGKIPGVVFKPAQGAIYQALQIPVKESEDFVRFMVSEFSYKGKTVMVTPMQDFYITPGRGRSEIRLAYVLDSRLLKEAMEILRRGLEAYAKSK